MKILVDGSQIKSWTVHVLMIGLLVTGVLIGMVLGGSITILSTEYCKNISCSKVHSKSHIW